MISRFWRALKVQRRLQFGPATLLYQFRRTVKVTEPPPPRLPVFPPAAAPMAAPRSLNTRPLGHAESALIFGAGPGLGESLATLLAEQGFNVGLVARDGPRLEALATTLRGHGVLSKEIGRAHV